MWVNMGLQTMSKLQLGSTEAYFCVSIYGAFLGPKLYSTSNLQNEHATPNVSCLFSSGVTLAHKQGIPSLISLRINVSRQTLPGDLLQLARLKSLLWWSR